MNTITFGLLLLPGFLGLAAAAYVAAYVVLRCFGMLSVTAGGWHAGSARLGRWVVCSALGLFGAFQPLMRFESSLAKTRHAAPKDQTVSDVVVEVVSFA